MKRYVITGAQGFVGRYVASRLLSANRKVEVLGLGRSPQLSRTFTHTVSWAECTVPAPLPDEVHAALTTDRYSYVSLDLRQDSELVDLLRDFHPDVVIHLATALRGDAPRLLLESNLEGTTRLLNALSSSRISLQKLLVCSTGGVYGIPGELPIREDAPCNPIDPYSASKLAAERLSSVLAARYQIPAAWARVFNVLGPGQDERHVCGQVAAQVAMIAAGLAPPVLVLGELEATRDFIDVRDAASALLLISERGEPGGTYNVASGNESRIHEIVEMSLQMAGVAGDVAIERKNVRASDVPRHVARTAKLRGLGFECRYSLAQSVRDLLDYYQQTVCAVAAASTRLSSASAARAVDAPWRVGGSTLPCPPG